MDEYINEYNKIIDELKSEAFKNSKYFLTETILELMNENEINELNERNMNLVRKIILKCIGSTTHDFIRKNIREEYKHLPISMLISSNNTEFLENSDINCGFWNVVNIYDYFSWYLGCYDVRYNNYYNIDDITNYITSMKQLELSLLNALRSEKNNYFSIIPKDIFNEIFNYFNF